MSSSPHELILASAGTGKTHRLTNRFLELLLDGVPPDKVLATTFTRKAAGEILDRVLERLVEAAEGETGRARLARELGRADLTSEACRALLARVTRGLDGFRVRTIDAFFVGLVRLYALDLGLPPDWSVSDARVDERIRSDAMGDALAEGDPGELIELLRELNEGRAGRGVHRAVLDRADRLRPLLLESREGAWDRLVPPDDVSDAAFDAALAAFATTELPRNQNGKPDGTFLKAWKAAEDAARAEDWKHFLESGLGKKVLEGEVRYGRREIEAEHLAVLEPLVARARHRTIALLAARSRALHDLLRRFELAYERRKRASGAYRFDDLPVALAPLEAERSPLEERELDLWFRLDGTVDHLLLDEFQDTTPVQWRILRPLAEELVADGTGERSFFCVGDVKQSIYGFRQAEPRLLAELERRLHGLEAERMTTSWRSSGVVLDLVNRVFEGIETSAAFADPERAAERRAAARWSVGFEAHDAARELPGVVEVHEAPPKSEERSSTELLVDLAVERVAELRRQAPRAEIGVLLRTRKPIPNLILRLGRAGVEASGEGGNELVDSRAVLAFLALLHLADHPDDRAAAFHVAHAPLGEVGALAPDASDSERRAFARSLRRRLMVEGLGSVASAVAAGLEGEPSWSDWDRARFGQLVEMAHAFEPGTGLRPSEFVDQVRAEAVESPGGGSVRVMTIHASKGLEFDAVVLPELDQMLVGQRGEVLVQRPDAAGPIELVTVAPTKKLLGVDGALRELYHAQTERMVEDSLSTLYVATTRAARRLELLVTNRVERGDGTAPRYSDLVLAALPPEELGPEGEGGLIWRHPDSASDSEWAPAAPGTEDGETPTATESLVLGPTTGPRSLARRSPSGEEGGGVVNAHQLLAPRTRARLGTLVHAWLEDLVWVEDFEPERERLLRLGARYEPDRSRREAALDELLAALDQPEIRSALTRPSAAPVEGAEPEVRREHDFSVVLSDPETGEDALWTGSIDRLVLWRVAGEVVAATVIDYKTDRVGGAELAERAEYYRPQLEGYARVVAAQTGLAPEAVERRLLFLSAGRTMTPS